MNRAQGQKALRCAIYTRKSSEEGLDQAFNSLHAQHDACEAYIRSQAGEGWRALALQYDDGGISGGTMERPALQRLLADIERGAVDVVVVYKVDRLTRSLGDFARIIEVFDRRGVSFVSVTQAFNTTNSMGRLTLNVLLSFAQFEREVTGERIRDKIAASKAKGMWMGGVPPLGYDTPSDKTSRVLIPNPGEAEVVRDIFRRYLVVKSVNALRDQLDVEAIRSKQWVTRKGVLKGGQPFSSGALYHLLRNRTYLGEIAHGEKSYPGAHPPILELDLFEAVQRQLKNNAVRLSSKRANLSGSLLLRGLLFDVDGQRMGPSFAYGSKGGRHAYYVSAALKRTKRGRPGSLGRIAASPLEALIRDRLSVLAETPDAELSSLLFMIQRIDVLGNGLQVSLNDGFVGVDFGPAKLSRLRALIHADDQLILDRTNGSVQLIIGVRPVFRGGRTWMVRPHGAPIAAVSKPDAQLIKALAQAHEGVAKHGGSPLQGPSDWVNARSIPDSYLRRLTGFAFLAPDIQLAILEGRQPGGLTALQVLGRGVPLAWVDQRELLGFPSA